MTDEAWYAFLMLSCQRNFFSRAALTPKTWLWGFLAKNARTTRLFVTNRRQKRRGLPKRAGCKNATLLFFENGQTTKQERHNHEVKPVPQNTTLMLADWWDMLAEKMFVPELNGSSDNLERLQSGFSGREPR